MNAFTASDLKAADPLALARHDGDGAPPAVTPPPASDGRGRHAIRRAGTGQVTASPAAVIAAAPGRARQQLGMRRTCRATRARPSPDSSDGRLGEACRAE
jgi:hypothetical protein